MVIDLDNTIIRHCKLSLAPNQNAHVVYFCYAMTQTIKAYVFHESESLLNPWSSTTFIAIPTCCLTVEGWSLQLRLHFHCNISCWPHHVSSSCELLPWYSNTTLTHICTLMYPLTRTSRVINQTITLKPWGCTSSCHMMSPKFGNILGSFGLIILVQSFIFHNLCIIFLVCLCHLYE